MNNSGISADDPKIFFIKCTWDSPIAKSFEGTCVDSGAQKTVIAVPQTMAYCDLFDEALKNDEDMEKLIYTFGSRQHKGIGPVNIRVPVSSSFFFSFIADVVDVYLPLLIGLDVLKSVGLILEFADDEVRAKADGWSLHLVRKHGHIYLFGQRVCCIRVLN